MHETADAIRAETGVRVIEVVADVSEPAGVARVTERALAEFGRVDVLVTNAGGPPAGPFESHSAEAWQEAIRQNLVSVVELTRAVLPGMKERRWGRIINVTSIAVKQPVDNLILSNSVRAAVTGFARTLANEVAPFGITVNNVMPGYTRTQRVEDLASATRRSKARRRRRSARRGRARFRWAGSASPPSSRRWWRSSRRSARATPPARRFPWTAAGSKGLL